MRAYLPKTRIATLEGGLRVRGDRAGDSGRQRSEVVEAGSNFFLATGQDARRVYGDLAELHALRLKRAGGYVFKRARLALLANQVSGRRQWRHESTHTESKRDAKALLTEKSLSTPAPERCRAPPASSRSSMRW